MKNNKAGTIIATAGLIMLSMSGCSSENAAEDLLPNDLGFAYSQVPAQSYVTPEEATNGSAFALLENENSIVAILGGSSSCPPTIESITKDDTMVNLNLKSYGDVACTMDFSYTGWQITSVATNYSFVGKTINTCIENACNALPVR